MCVLQSDAEYFKIDLPNSGEVILSKPLDYETKTQLTVTIHASVSYVPFCFWHLSIRFHHPSHFHGHFPVNRWWMIWCNVHLRHINSWWSQEMSTAERFNTSTTITITILDGDDQYPQFLPCTLLYQDDTSRVCTSPVYTVNVTEGQEVSW